MGCDIVTGGGPGLMQAATKELRRLVRKISLLVFALIAV
jgi:predicted Rossmann-fold nucleotide-binding protein